MGPTNMSKVVPGGKVIPPPEPYPGRTNSFLTFLCKLNQSNRLHEEYRLGSLWNLPGQLFPMFKLFYSGREAPSLGFGSGSSVCGVTTGQLATTIFRATPYRGKSISVVTCHRNDFLCNAGFGNKLQVF